MANRQRNPANISTYGPLTLDGTTTTNYTGIIIVPRATVVSVQLVWTATSGSLNATATLQETNHPFPDSDTDTDWVDNADVTFTDPAGSDSKELENIGNMGASTFRIKFARSSSSGDRDWETSALSTQSVSVSESGKG